MNVVRVEHDGDVAWVTIENPPVNATSTEVRTGLWSAVDDVQGARLAILHCLGRTFIAGGDMREFDRPAQEPHLPDLVDKIENSGTPFLALLHGSVLGGGLEVAMAAAFRIAVPETRFGLPEVNVGLIPGAGGSQRAPRLFGWDAAFEMACLGRLVSAERALELGAIDAIEDHPKKSVSEYRKKLPPEAVSRRKIDAPGQSWLVLRREELGRRSRGRKAPQANLEALTWAVRPYTESQPRERAHHLEMRKSDECRALRHVFFAERAVGRPEIVRGREAGPVESVAVIGGGLMGAGIAVACLNAGLPVIIVERDAAGEKAARVRVRAMIGEALSRGKIDRAERTRQFGLLSTCSEIAGAKDADIVIEAVFEDITTKQEVFREVGSVVRQTTVLATNTSYLNPEEIFRVTRNRERSVGLHFFAPAHIMKLLEVVRLRETSVDTLATVFSFGKRLRKIAVPAGNSEGFIGNRMLSDYRRAAEYMLADGAFPDEIDSAMRAFGMAMGPFETQDASGLDIAESNRRRLDTVRDPDERYVGISDRLCARGRYGRKTGAGWYRYHHGDRTPHCDPEVIELISAYSAEHGITRETITGEEIRRQLIAVLANTGALLVEDGIAANDATIDLVKIHGYGFPGWKGGPMYTAGAMGNAQIRAALDSLEAASPGSWRRARRYNRETPYDTD